MRKGPPSGFPVRSYVRRIQAMEIGTEPGQFALEDEKLNGGYLVWTGDEGSEWVYCPREVFKAEYEPIAGPEVS